MTSTLETTLDRGEGEFSVTVEYRYIKAGRPGRDEYGRPTEPPGRDYVEIIRVVDDGLRKIETSVFETERLEELCREDYEND